MYNPTTIFNKILELIPRQSFEYSVYHLGLDKYSKHFSTWNLLVVLLGAQAKGWNSLREIQTGFKSHESKLYHLGIKSLPKRSTISRKNNKVDPQVFEKLFHTIRKDLQSKLVKKSFDFEINKVMKIVDSSTVNVSIELFDWAKFRYNKGAIKLHTSFNLTDQIPEFINITDGSVGDINGINFSSFKNCILSMDRGYTDFSKWKILNENNVDFVIRLKKNIALTYLGQHQKSTGEGIIADEVVEFSSKPSKEVYPDRLRVVKTIDKETGEVYTFITNNFTYSAELIGYIYKKRWEIELFFKWIKQNLKIKTFFGTSENAVKSQIWVAMIYYLLLRYIQGQTSVKSILEFTRVLKELLFDNRPIFDIYSEEFRSQTKRIDVDVGQLMFFS